MPFADDRGNSIASFRVLDHRARELSQNNTGRCFPRTGSTRARGQLW